MAAKPLDRRDKELATNRQSKIYKDLIEEFGRIRRGFEDQGDRSDQILDNWDCYNCTLNNNQAYNGNAELYVPIVRNAVNARKTRFVNQIFPSSGRYIDAASDDGSIPHAIVALLEHYVRKTKLRTQIMMALCRNGDLEGQYNLEVDWNELERHVTSRVERGAQVEVPGLGAPHEDEDEPVEDIVDEDIVDAWPGVDVVHDTDVLVLPTTVDSIESALARGGSVTLIKRWTRETLKQKIADGEVVEKYAQLLLDAGAWTSDIRDIAKDQVDAAGIKATGTRHVLVYVTWKNLKVDGKFRLCRIIYGGYNLILSCRRNPFWNDRCNLLSVPVDKVAGSFKGQAPVTAVASTQYHANDIANEAADSATYSMMPIVAADVARMPRSSTLLVNLGALWEIPPDSIKFMEFPKLWQDGIALIQADMQSIFMTLSVNPAMLTQQTGRPGAKRNQAEIALETTVDLLATAEACSVLEEGILTPLMTFFGEYDSQFRDDDITVRAYGELGVEARMERIKPRQFGNRYTFTWFGVEQARNAAQMQQQIAWLNVARGMGPDLQRQGYMLNVVPVLEASAQNVFGARLGRLVLRDARAQLSIDPHEENMMLLDGFAVPVSPMDADPQHLQSHQQALKQTGDPSGMIRIHMNFHMQQMQMKAQAMMAQRQAQQGGQRQLTGPGRPQPGAVPMRPHAAKAPPGAIAAESMSRAGVPSAMPRRM